MTLLRRIGLIIAGMVFRSMLVFTVSSAALVVIAGSAGHIKSALTATKVYDRFVPSIIEANSAQAQSSESIPLNDPEIAAIINGAFPPSVLQTNAEMVIDSTYSWLNGKTLVPAFRVDLTGNKEKLAQDMGKYAVNRLAGQQVCTVLPAAINPFTATCRPAGFDAAVQEPILVKQIAESPNLLPKTVFTVEDLPKVKSGRVITERYNYAPRYYKLVMWSPWIFGLVLVLSGTGIVLLSRTKRIGLNRLGFELLSNGILFMASPIIFGYVLPALTKNIDLPDTSGAGSQVVLNDAIRYYRGFFDNFFINAGIYLCLAGLLAVVTARALQGVTGYHQIETDAGLVSSNAPRAKTGKVILTAADVPVQSSDSYMSPVKTKSKAGRKYRTIPKKEF